MRSLLPLVLPLLVFAEPDLTHDPANNLEKRVTRYVDQGNLFCLTENYPIPQGSPRYFMTLEEANNAAYGICSYWQINELNPGANPGKINREYFAEDASRPTYHNITVGVTYNGGDDCPYPKLNFWYDVNLPGDSQTHCYDRLSTIINGCDTVKEGDSEYWKQGGSFYRDCATWEIWKTLNFG